MTSYFEISGHIVECSTDDNTSHPSSISMVSVAERPERGRNLAMNENFSSRTSARGLTVSDVADVASRVGRAQRARRAISIAAMLAAADGPLPIGDTLAIVGLTIYAGWELGHATGILD